MDNNKLSDSPGAWSTFDRFWKSHSSDSEGGRSVNMRIVGYKRLTFKILGAAHETSCDLLNRLHGGKLVALLPSNKKVLGSTPGREYFCMEFACLNQFQYSVFLGTHNFQLKDLLDIGSSVSFYLNNSCKL
ncbi:hypothetical protein GOODEAATRI_009854 [Goodea atripinnis]|uniref:Uncharacterized protein n=1 Tax=Goodea atripinnis TaxID=208336 RepID=A0ABV0P2V9_9TELE